MAAGCCVEERGVVGELVQELNWASMSCSMSICAMKGRTRSSEESGSSASGAGPGRRRGEKGSGAERGRPPAQGSPPAWWTWLVGGKPDCGISQ
jgi:hypothetical protein